MGKCTCANGVPADASPCVASVCHEPVGPVCTANGAEICASCSDLGYFLDAATASCKAHSTCGVHQFVEVAGTPTSDVVCADKVCTCSNGVEAAGAACTANGAEICASCSDPGYFLEAATAFHSVCKAHSTCGAHQFVEVAGTPTSDVVCADNVCTCSNGVEAAGAACTANGDELCARCPNPDNFLDTATASCKAHSTCGAHQFVEVAGTPTSDVVCADNVCTCSNGVEAAGAACTANGAKICASCSDSGNFLDAATASCKAHSTCGAHQFVAVAGTPTSDVVCADNVCTCSNGVEAAGAACTANGAKICASCSDSGNYLDAATASCKAHSTCGAHQFVAVAGTPTSDVVCVDNVCTCSNGVEATGAACPVHGAEVCVSCTTSQHFLVADKNRSPYKFCQIRANEVNSGAAGRADSSLLPALILLLSAAVAHVLLAL